MKALIFDFSRTILFPENENYLGELNALYKQEKDKPDFKFWDHFKLNSDLLEFLEQIKNKYSLYVFTSGSVQNSPEVAEKTTKLFKEVFSAKELGVDKKEQDAYKVLCEKVNINPEDCLFVDDSEANILAAGYSGMKTIHYKNFEDFKNQIEKILG